MLFLLLYGRYEEGELRVITTGPIFAGLVAKSFDQIWASAAGNLGVMLRMLGALQTIGSLTTVPSRRHALLTALPQFVRHSPTGCGPSRQN